MPNCSSQVKVESAVSRCNDCGGLIGNYEGCSRCSSTHLMPGYSKFCTGDYTRACSSCGGTRKVKHQACNGTGNLNCPKTVRVWMNCDDHNSKDAHNYCALSTDNHGTNVSEYH